MRFFQMTLSALVLAAVLAMLPATAQAQGGYRFCYGCAKQALTAPTPTAPQEPPVAYPPYKLAEEPTIQEQLNAINKSLDDIATILERMVERQERRSGFSR